MFDHVSLQVSNFGKSLAFYRAALAPLGLKAQAIDESAKSAGFGPEGSPGLWIAEAPAEAAADGRGRRHVHIAFASPDRSAVARFFQAACGAGGTDNGKPGPRPAYSERYYAAFVLDPDGNNIEAVTLAEK
jgi:catechol 2,3-dioxygenase-like lactoylglutathione lyase family enzyme